MSSLHRRNLIKQIALGTLTINSLNSFAACAPAKEEAIKTTINNSVCRWTYDFLPLDDLCQTVLQIGFNAIDLVGPKDWNTLKKHGVYSSMCNGAEISLTEGWNNKQYHPTLIKNYTTHIDLVSKAGYKN